MLLSLLALTLASLCARPLANAKHYIDVQHGSDANGGTSPADAWKTLTHAASTIPTLPVGQWHELHIAPGVYDAASGESFPIAMRPGWNLAATGGGAVLDGGGQNVDLLHFISGTGGTPDPFGIGTGASGLTLRRAARGMLFRSDAYPVVPPIYGNDISEMSVAAIEIDAVNAIVVPFLSDLKLVDNAVGIAVNIADAHVMSGFVLADSEITGSAGPAIDFSAAGSTQDAHGRIEMSNVMFDGNGAGIRAAVADRGSLDLRLDHSKIRGSAGLAIDFSAAGATLDANGKLDLTQVLLDGNAAGIRARAAGHGSFEVQLDHATLVRSAVNGVTLEDQDVLGQACVAAIHLSTIADNGALGVATIGAPIVFDLAESIVSGHGDDLSLAAGTLAVVAYCDLGDGDFAGTNGNFSADPRFVAPALGDYTLQANSPCIDAGDPNAGLESNCTLRDIGAYDFGDVGQTVYCTAKLNSCGTLPFVSTSGAPSASASSGFTIRVDRTKAGASGLLLYGLQGRAATAFDGGLLCLAGRARRAVALVDTVGTGANCDGQLQIDMNAFAHGQLGGAPAAALTSLGKRVDCQFWAHDVAGSSLLSNALEYHVCP